MNSTHFHLSIGRINIQQNHHHCLVVIPYIINVNVILINLGIKYITFDLTCIIVNRHISFAFGFLRRLRQIPITYLDTVQNWKRYQFSIQISSDGKYNFDVITNQSRNLGDMIFKYIERHQGFLDNFITKYNHWCNATLISFKTD